VKNLKKKKVGVELPFKAAMRQSLNRYRTDSLFRSCNIFFLSGALKCKLLNRLKLPEIVLFATFFAHMLKMVLISQHAFRISFFFRMVLKLVF
jgi:hypothetical protein